MNLRLALLVAAAVCFAVAVLIAVGAVHSNYDGFLAGGLLSCVLSLFATGNAPA